MKEGINRLRNELGFSRILTQSRAWQARYCHLDHLRWMNRKCKRFTCYTQQALTGGVSEMFVRMVFDEEKERWGEKITHTHLKWCAGVPKISSSTVVSAVHFNDSRWCSCVLSVIRQEFSRFHKEIQPMFDGLNNNRSHWNELAEVYNAKMKAIEDEKKKLEEEEAKKCKNR